MILLREKAYLKRYFPNFRVEVNGNILKCEGSMKPTAFSQSYRFELIYQYGKNPKTRILSSHILIDLKIHMFENGYLCLYYWKENPWNIKYHLFETIIPWLAEWILYYEVYELTGKWQGISAEHGARKEIPKE